MSTWLLGSNIFILKELLKVDNSIENSLKLSQIQSVSFSHYSRYMRYFYSDLANIQIVDETLGSM